MAQASTTRRSQTDFEQLRFLGSGAFGEVHMCRNRIDGQLYALKVVKIRVDDARRDKVLREARLLSSLTHSRIVRYFQCWIEAVEEDVIEDGQQSRTNPSADVLPTIVDGCIADVETPPASAPIHGTPPTGALTTATAAAAPALTPRLACNICSKNYLDWFVAFSAWSALDASLQPLNLCQECYKLALINLGFDLSRISISHKGADNAANGGVLDSNADKAGFTPSVGGPSALPSPPPRKTVVASYLYIQTEFCERTLLEECVEIIKRYTVDGKDVTSPGNLVSDGAAAGGHAEGVGTAALTLNSQGNVTTELSVSTAALVITPHAMARIWQLFWEIVEGLAYLHGSNVVHRFVSRHRCPPKYQLTWAVSTALRHSDKAGNRHVCFDQSLYSH
jgi:serine/threonine protein kinase